MKYFNIIKHYGVQLLTGRVRKLKIKNTLPYSLKLKKNMDDFKYRKLQILLNYITQKSQICNSSRPYFEGKF